MKKLLFLFYTILLLGNGLLSQPQISWRFANPEIIRLTTTDRLEFDLQVKASENGKYLFSGQYNLTFNNSAFLTSNVNTTVIRSGISNQISDDLGDYKYAITRNNTGVSPNIVINVALTPLDATILQEEPSSAWSAEITTEWQTFTRLRITINNPGLLAGISFIEASMNGQISYHSAPGVITNFTSPNLYEPLNLNLLNLGRIYSAAHGWSQVGVNQIDWATSVNTTVFDGQATITQTNNTAAMATNLNIMEGAGLTIGSDKWLTVNGTLTTPNTDALVIADKGSLIHNSASVNAKFQRNITGGSISANTHRYHLISVPMSSEYTAGDLFTGLHLWEMNALTQGWSKIFAASHTISNLEGYLLWHDGSSHSLEIAGSLNAGNVNLPVKEMGIASGNSYRLIPNPYPSALQWSTPGGYDAAVYFFNAATGNYVTFADGVPSPAIIPSGQSFFIKTTTPGGNANALTINNANRLHHNQNLYKATTDIACLLKLKATSEVSEDETYIRFHDQATNYFDPEKDARKLSGFGDAPQLYTVTDDINYAINALQITNSHVVVPMNFEMNPQGTVQLEASGMHTFAPGAAIFLEDIYLNQMINLSEQAIYSFEHLQNINADRFRIHFYGVLETNERPTESWKVWSYNKYIYISIPEMNESSAKIELFDITGREIYRQKHAIDNPIIIYGGDISQLVFVKINTASKTHTAKIIIR